jgi:hypothetical protein
MAELVLTFGLIGALFVLDRILARIEARNAVAERGAPIVTRAGRSIDANGRTILEIAPRVALQPVASQPAASQPVVSQSIASADAQAVQRPAPAKPARKAVAARPAMAGLEPEVCGCSA